MNKPEHKLNEILGYQFKDPDLLLQALTHRSALGKHNERLEFLGDGLLGAIIADALYRTFPKADEGQMTRMRAKLVCKESLANIARELTLPDYVLLGEGERKSAGFRRDSILADTLEAIIGAVYLDSDWVGVQQVVMAWYVDKIAKLDYRQAQKDAKTRLQEWLQARSLSLPSYEVVQIDGPQHEQSFTVKCTLETVGETFGRGVSKRLAEQSAAELMLIKVDIKND